MSNDTALNIPMVAEMETQPASQPDGLQSPPSVATVARTTTPGAQAPYETAREIPRSEETQSPQGHSIPEGQTSPEGQLSVMRNPIYG